MMRASVLGARVLRVVAVGVRSTAPRRINQALVSAARSVTTRSVASLAWRDSVARCAVLGASRTSMLERSTPLLLLRSSFSSHSHSHSSSSSSSDNIVQFKLADVGEGIAECEVLRWYIDVGQKISQFQKLCEVQSDKATVEITSRYDGIIKHLHYSVGDMARVGSALVDIALEEEASSDESDGHPAARASVGAATTAVDAPAASSSSGFGGFDRHGKVLATPAVRRIAMENNVDLTLVTSSGKDGRISKQDILDFVSSGGRSSRVETAKQVVESVAKAQIRSPAAAAAPAAAAPIPSAPLPAPKILVGEDVEVPIRGIQKIMVKTMTAATAVPHFGYSDEIEIDKLMEAREQLKPIAESRGIRLSYMPLMLKALSVSLRSFPVLNSHTNADCTSYIQRARHNIGVAMDTPAGLMVPNIKDVQARTVFEIAQELNRLQALGREGKLSTDDLSGGTFTLSNIGVIGGTYASPVLFLPEVAIGALGKVQKLPRYNADGQVVPVHIVNISWSADHRVIDGATMARFGNRWKELLENPALLLAELR